MMEFPVERFDKGQWILDADKLDIAFKYVTDWRCAVDVGAFAGVFTSRIALRFERVYAIEPNFKSFCSLSANMIAYPNVTCVHAAAADRTDEIVYIQRKCWPSARILKSREKDGDEIRTIRIDDLTDASGLVKIDVEGYEYKVLCGAGKLLASKPVVIVESKGHHRRYDGIDPVKHLKRLGMKVVAEIRPDVILAW